MTPSDFKRLFDTTVTELQMLAAVRSGEYASDADHLASFRDASRRTGLTPAQVLLVHLDQHYSAVCNYIRDGLSGTTRARTTPIETQVNDMLVHLILFKALLSETRSVAGAINADEGPRLVWDNEQDD